MAVPILENPSSGSGVGSTIVDYASTANVNIITGLVNGTAFGGGTLVTGQRVLLKDQTNKIENGVRVVAASGVAVRDSTWADGSDGFGKVVTVRLGSNAGTSYLETSSPAIVNANNLHFEIIGRGVNTEEGEVISATASAIITTAQTSFLTAQTILTFTLPSAGRWELNPIVRGRVDALQGRPNAAQVTYGIFDGTGTLIANSETNIAMSQLTWNVVPAPTTVVVNPTVGGTASNTVKVSTTGSEVFTVRAWNSLPDASHVVRILSNADGRTSIKWKKIGGAIPGTMIGAVQGALQLIDRTTDLGDWILLNGRLKSTLTPAQQAVATALGYGASIPDMRGRLPIGAGGTAAVAYQALAGTDNILQNQLPNVTLGGSTSDPGGHTHTITSWTGTKANVSGGSGLGVLDVLGQSSPPSQTSSSAGGHTHTVTTASINGGVTQQKHLPPVRGSNWFVWLGSNASTANLASPMVGANGTIAGTAGTAPAPAATDNTRFLRGDATYGDAIGKLSTATGISALTAGTVTTLYTVPVGRSLNVTHIAIKTNAVTGTVTANPALSIGSNASSYDNLMATTIMIGVVSAGRVFNHPIFGAAPIFTGGSVIGLQIDIAQAGATALTYDVELYGVLS